ncbi:FKBP-type 22 kDa peptidyl-prolyl cis-trans isomerase [termite gut metagenome]|uniref:peptidylprolyl isomerase n=1 Tax=termite gut metagenome TaxID=433724 RepID=A0A5J4RU02_9ZZZZ
MKKVCFFITVVAAAIFVSCTQNPKVSLKTELDSLIYSMGVAESEGLRSYLTGGMNVDTLYLSEFIKGLNQGANAKEGDHAIKKNMAYSAGLRIGLQIGSQIVNSIKTDLFGEDSTKTINKDDFVAGLIHGLNNNKSIMSVDTAKAYSQTISESIKAKRLEVEYADNKAAGEKFLEENKAKEGIQTTSSGLQYKIITVGKGAIPTAENTVKVHYKGTLLDGTEFDSSLKRKDPSTFRADQVIKGWTEALTLMPVGSKWELYIPQELAYGTRNSGQIKPFSALIFEVELIGIEK